MESRWILGMEDAVQEEGSEIGNEATGCVEQEDSERHAVAATAPGDDYSPGYQDSQTSQEVDHGDQEGNEEARANIALEGENPQRHFPAKQARAKADAKDLKRILEQQDYACASCGCDLIPEKAELDHKTPMSDGGTHAALNLQWLCKDCNRAKGSMPMGAFIAMCQRIVKYHANHST
jgi:hypothetical protein